MIGQLTDNFHIDEFSCNDANKTPVPLKYILNVLHLARNLQVLRSHVNKRTTISSGYRTPVYNKSVGGKSRSKHLKAEAGDIVIKGMTPKEVYDTILELIAMGKMDDGGLSLYDTFVHYDISTPRRW